MRHPHIESGGRYPALRTIAILYLVGALIVTLMGIWQAISVFRGGDTLTSDLFGTPSGVLGKIMTSVSWLAVTFIAVLGMFAFAELIKLFIDIEHNTRSIAHRAATTAASDTGNSEVREGPGLPFVGDRKMLDGDETAEGALLRGH